MDYEKLRILHEQFANDYAQISKEFGELFAKWLRKCPKTTIVASVHLPISIIMNLIESDKNGDVYEAFPELPQVLERFLAPFKVIEDQWGKISGKEFVELYSKLYEKQFDPWFPSKDDKEKFAKAFPYDKINGEQKS